MIAQTVKKNSTVSSAPSAEQGLLRRHKEYAPNATLK